MEKNKHSDIKNLIIHFLLVVFILLLIAPKKIFERPSISGAVLSQVRIINANLPKFDYNLTNQTINQTSTFFFDVNCSDADAGDVITYYDDFSGFDINSSTGIMNQTNFNQSFVGNNTITIFCSDGKFNTTQTFVLTVLDVNEAPVLSPIGPQIATEGVLFTLELHATDPENDSLTFNASTTLFTVNSSTGLINFTPSLSQVGNYTINISVFDGQLYDYEVISFRIVRGPFCGDGSCGNNETCVSCQDDCGNCPVSTAPEEQPQGGGEEGSEGGEGEGGGEAAVEIAPQAPAEAPAFYRCDPKWECSDWSACGQDQVKTRKCTDINNCNKKQKKPAETTKCEYQVTCSDGIKNGNEEAIDCGGLCPPCLVPNCFDNIKNQNEENIDCGGLCSPCETKKFAKTPFFELPAIISIPKKFPWLLVFIVLVIIILTFSGDKAYVKRLSKKDLEEYSKRMRKYRPLRKKLYKFMANVSIVTLVASLYIYQFSNNVSNMKKYSWIPAIIILFIPIAVSYFMTHYAYYEYKKRRKEERLKQTHKREILQLIGVENRLLLGIESKLKDKVYSLSVHHKFDDYRDLYKELNPMYGLLSSLGKHRNNRVEISKISSDIFNMLSDLKSNKTLIKASKEYPEFMSILKIIEYITDNINLETYDSEEDFLDEMSQISKPHMITVIKSIPELATLYNKLEDIYEYLVEKHEETQNSDKEVSAIERSFTDKIKELAKKALLLETIQKDSDFASIYNALIDLFNHYLKKQELSAKIKNL